MTNIYAMKIRFFLFAFILIFSFKGYSQDNLAAYKRAKTLIGYGNYSDAMELMRPYMDESKFGNLAYYAKFHFGFCAFQNGQYELASSILLPLSTQDKWADQDEARYLLALIYFEEAKNFEALQEISLIKDPEIFALGERASLKYLKNTSVSFLISNLKNFNSNKGFQVALREKLEEQSIMSNDERAILQQLGNINTITDSSKANNKNPQYLDIAVILPFNYSGGSDVASLTHGNFVLELYQGIHYALNELISNGENINVKTFDTQRSNSRIQSILNEPFVLKSDVIIGPIYPEETEIVLQFSQKNNIPFINPLSNLDDKIQGADNAYLFRPAVSSLSESLLKYLEKNLDGKKLAIAYSNASRDEQLVSSILEDGVQQGFKIIEKTLVTPKNINQFFDAILLSQDGSSKTDAVIILSDDPNIAQASFGYMESKNIKTPVIVMDSWLYFNFASYEMLETQNFVFLGNNSIDFSNPNLDKFREGFYEEFGKFPSLNMHLGYDLTHWLAQTIGPNKGFDFRENLNKNGFINGKITYGFDFRKANNNLYVPVLKLFNGKLEVN
jgi:ABC-type branched-subunit amino acid transport system substrate-binding protein